MSRKVSRRQVITLSLAFLLLTVAADAAVPAPAPAPLTLSFASDDNHDGPTFRGNSGGSAPSDLVEASGLSIDGIVNVDLMVDKNGDATGGVVTLPSRFFFAGSISGYTLTPRGSGWVIQWDVNGSFAFTDATTNALLLTVNFDNALLTTFSPNINTLGQTATLQSSNDVDSGLSFTATSLFLSKVGVSAFSLSNSEDFAFTFTNLRNIDGGGGLPMIDHGLFLRNWASEGSFSAHTSATAVVYEEDGTK